MASLPFKVGIVHAMVFPEVSGGEGPVVETARAIVEDDFFDAIEVSWVKDPSVRRNLFSLLKSSHIHVVFCAGGNIIRERVDLNSLDQPTRRRAIQFTRDLVAQAKELKAEIFVLCSGPDPGQSLRSKAASALVDSLVEIAEYAGSDMMVSLEAFDREIDKRRLVGPTQEAVSIVSEVRQRVNNVGLTVDLSHLPLLNESAATSLETARGVLVHSHIGNCMPNADSHPPLAVPGGCNGVQELREFLMALKSIGYFNRACPIVSFEVKPTRVGESESLIAQSKGVLMEAMSGLT